MLKSSIKGVWAINHFQSFDEHGEAESKDHFLNSLSVLQYLYFSNDIFTVKEKT